MNEDLTLAREVVRAHERLKFRVTRTPVFTSSTVDAACDRQVFFKAENLQKTGSFKLRGALNALLKATDEGKRKLDGVATHSSGNHGQALAYAAWSTNKPCTVVCPHNVNSAKLTATKQYATDVVLCEPTMESRVKTCQQIVKESGYHFVHPHDDLDVMAGQGTVAVELLEQVNNLDAVLVPTGGGGLVSGIATWVKFVKPHCQVFCVEPEGKRLQESFTAGRPLWTDPKGVVDTVADGLRVQRLGGLCFQVALRNCNHRVLTVNDTEIVNATRLIYERLKLVVEPSAAVGLAALLRQNDKLPNNFKRVAIILTGGNQDLSKMAWSK